MVYFNILFAYLQLVFFIYMFIFNFADLFKILLPLLFSVTLLTIYFYLFFKDIEDDINNLCDF